VDTFNKNTWKYAEKWKKLETLYKKNSQKAIKKKINNRNEMSLRRKNWYTVQKGLKVETLANQKRKLLH